MHDQSVGPPERTPPSAALLVLSQAQEQSQIITSVSGMPTQMAPLMIDAKAESKFPS